jgi:hypothetical protein
LRVIFFTEHAATPFITSFFTAIILLRSLIHFLV